MMIDFVGKWKIYLCRLPGSHAFCQARLQWAINSGAGNGALNLQHGFHVAVHRQAVTFNAG